MLDEDTSNQKGYMCSDLALQPKGKKEEKKQL